MSDPTRWFDPLLDPAGWFDSGQDVQSWFNPELQTPQLVTISAVGDASFSVSFTSLTRYSRLSAYGLTGRFLAVPAPPAVITAADGLAEFSVSFLADGSWLTAAATVVDESSGGWSNYFDVNYEREIVRRRRQRLEQRELEQETEAIPNEIDREIALLLRDQEAKAAKRAELDRLRILADSLKAEEARLAYGERVAQALDRAMAKGSFSALEALDREIQRAREEEESVILASIMILNED